MPHYYAVCQQEDQELTEHTLIAHFVDHEDMLCDGPYSGSMLYSEIAVGFFVKNKDTFDRITDRLLSEAIWFLDESGEMIDFN